MSRKKALAILGLTLFAVSSCSFWNRSLEEVLNDPFDRKNQPIEAPSVKRKVYMAPLQMPRNVVVCRAKQCAPLKLSMSKEYIYNSLTRLIQANNNQKALICAADASTSSCYANYVALPITVGITPAYMYVDSVKINDVRLEKGARSLDMLLNYHVTYNGQTPDCAPDQTMLFVKNADNIIMEDNGYQCKMTTIGTTTVKTLFLVDYIDLDYGYIGGYYSIGLSGPAYGGGSGYMMLRLPNQSYPMKPNPKEKEPVAPSPAKVKANNYMAAPTKTEPTVNNSTTTAGVQVFPIKRNK